MSVKNHHVPPTILRTPNTYMYPQQDKVGTQDRTTCQNISTQNSIDEKVQGACANLVETALGLMSLPCCMSVPTANQKAFDNVNTFSTTSVSGLHGCGLYHSYGLQQCDSVV